MEEVEVVESRKASFLPYPFEKLAAADLNAEERDILQKMYFWVQAYDHVRNMSSLPEPKGSALELWLLVDRFQKLSVKSRDNRHFYDDVSRCFEEEFKFPPLHASEEEEARKELIGVAGAARGLRGTCKFGKATQDDISAVYTMSVSAASKDVLCRNPLDMSQYVWGELKEKLAAAAPS